MFKGWKKYNQPRWLLSLLFQFESEIQGLFPHLFSHLKHRLQDPTLTPYTHFSMETKALKPQDLAKVTNK